MANNTIFLVHGTGQCPKRHWMKSVNPGDSIWGIDSESKQLRSWPIDQEAEARAELAKYRCEYRIPFDTVWIEEYALEWCVTDEDGEFLEGSDYELAETDEE